MPGDLTADQTVNKLDAIKHELDDVKKAQPSDQQLYDDDRSAAEDAQQADKDAHNKKPNDITFSPNRTIQQQLSLSTYMMVHNATPMLPRHFIGQNAYILVPRRSLKLFSLDAITELEKIHGKHEYPIPNDLGYTDYNSEVGLAVPVRAQNTPQPFDLPQGIEPQFSADDLWQTNLELDRERRAS